MIDEELLYPEMVGQMLLAMVQTFRPNSGLVSRSQIAFTRKGSGTMPMRGLCRTPRNSGVDNCIPHHASPRNRPPTTTGVA